MRGIAERSAEEAHRFGRRAFIRTAALGAVAGGTGVLPALLASRPASAATTFVPADPDLHLLRRATYGPTPAASRSIRRMGAGTWLDQQLDPTSINDSFIDDFIASRYPNLSKFALGKFSQMLKASATHPR